MLLSPSLGQISYFSTGFYACLKLLHIIAQVQGQKGSAFQRGRGISSVILTEEPHQSGERYDGLAVSE